MVKNKLIAVQKVLQKTCSRMIMSLYAYGSQPHMVHATYPSYAVVAVLKTVNLHLSQALVGCLYGRV